MLNTTSTTICLIIIILLTITGCNKTTQTAENTTNDLKTNNLSVSDTFMGSQPATLQLFEIQTNEDVSIRTKTSAVVFIPKGCFKRKDGSTVTGKVAVEVREVQSNADFIRNGIQTLSDGKLLASGGSYYFNATENGAQLEIDSTKGVQFTIMSNVAQNSEMKLFSGEQLPNGDVNWKLLPAKINQKKIEIPKDNPDKNNSQKWIADCASWMDVPDNDPFLFENLNTLVKMIENTENFERKGKNFVRKAGKENLTYTKKYTNAQDVISTSENPSMQSYADGLLLTLKDCTQKLDKMYQKGAKKQGKISKEQLSLPNSKMSTQIKLKRSMNA